jgi:hypothetical protein
MPANCAPFDLNHLNPGEHPWSPDDLAHLGRAVATLQQSWEDANAVLAALVNAALRDRRASISIPANDPPPGLTFEAACSRLARAVRLVEEFAPTQPGWSWLVAGPTLFNPDRPDFVDSLLRLIDPGPGNEHMPRLSTNADVLRGQIAAPHLEHAALVRAELAKLTRKVDELDRQEQERRPPAPTRDYCMPKRGVIRWVGDAKDVNNRFWDLLDRLFELGGNPLPFRDVGAGVKDRTIANRVYGLNRHLQAVQFPWCARRQGRTIVRGDW